MAAVAHITEVQGFGEFSRDDVRRRIGVEIDTWLYGYTAIFQGMRIDHPGKAPVVGERFASAFRRVCHGRYVLTPKGKQLAREFVAGRAESAPR